MTLKGRVCKMAVEPGMVNGAETQATRKKDRKRLNVSVG